MIDYSNRTYCPCSGQRGFSPGAKRDWGIRRVDNNPAWWRANDKAGRQRKFASYEAAEAAALKLEAQS